MKYAATSATIVAALDIACLGLPVSAIAGESVPVILIQGAPWGPGGASLTDDAPPASPADTGVWLRQQPGVAGLRLGGHGVDPVIRGQAESRINILLDGAYVHGGCPNRMDPATAYAPLESYDNVIMIRSNQTVRYGGGGSGGTLLLKRDTAALTADEHFHGRLHAGHAGNGDRSELSLDGAAGNSRVYGRAIVGRVTANNYRDGDGVPVRSGLQERSATLIAGYRFDDGGHVEINAGAVRGEDILYAGMMDAPAADMDKLGLKYTQHLHDAWQVQAEAYLTDVEHLMDNYSLRAPGASMRMRVPSTSRTHGGRILLESTHADTWLFGIDLQDNSRDAVRYGGPAVTTINSYLWPDVRLDQWGVFIERGISLDTGRRLRGGLRYDRVSAQIGRADADPPGMSSSPNQLYAAYYGHQATASAQANVGGFVRYEAAIDRHWSWSANLSRSVRSPDATERFMAANAMNAAQRWVGNPTLQAEKHRQLELGLNWRGGIWETQLLAHLDAVDDYILRDRAHGQDGVLQTDSASIYRNVNARLYGAEFMARARLTSKWSLHSTLALVRGRNRTDDRDLAQMPPLEMTIALAYRRTDWQLHAGLRLVQRQMHVDDDPATGSGLDSGQTPGFAVMDVSGGYRIDKRLQLQAGVDNLFNRRYAEHLNRANDFDPVQEQINEPGRSLWLRLRAQL